MSTLDARKNFSIAAVSTGYALGDTSIALATGKGALFPQPSTDGAFNVVWWNFTDYPSPADDPNVEIVRVTARTTDTLTVTRAQEGTSATAKNTSGKTYRMILAPTAKMITDIETALDGKQASLGYTPENVANKGIANGYVPLGADTKIATTYLPALAITDTFVVASQAAMLALTAETGDVAVRTDLNKSFILTASPASTLGNWQELLTPTDAVTSVNGQTGAVSLATNNISEGGGVLYFTNARAIASTLTGYTSGAGTISSADSILQAIQKLNGNVAALVTGVSSVSGTSNRTSVNQSTGAVIVDISSSYVGQGTITTLGTIATGVWQGTIIGGTYINYNSTNLKVTTSQLNTIQDIATSSTPQFARIGIGTAAGATTEQTVLQPVRTTGSPTMVTWTGGAHTTLTASTEATDINFNLARTVQFATGAITTQRAIYIQAPTYAFVGASTITNAYTFYISGAPTAGTNATITTPWALGVNGNAVFGTSSAGTGSVGLGVNQGIEFAGSVNSDSGGPQIQVTNINTGTSAWGGFTISNNLVDGSQTHFFGMYLNSSNYTSTAFGSAIGVANLGILQNTDGPLSIIASGASKYVNFIVAGSATTNEVGRWTTAGLTVGLAGTLTGAISLPGATSGTAVLTASAVAGTTTITIPAITSTMALLSGTQTFDGSKTFSSTITTTRIDCTRSSLGTTLTQGLTAYNLTSATGGAPVQISPYIGWQGTAYTGAASQTVVFYSYVKGINGTNPVTANLIFGSNINAAGNNDRMFLSDDGRLGIGQAATAVVHIKAGTATASTAPLKFTSGTNLTTAEAGAMEYDGTNLFFTRAGTTRENVLVAVDNASAPSTTATPTFTSYYGGNTKALGDPNRWCSVNILGTVYKIPMYT